MQGMNFSNPASQPPSAIPQMNLPQPPDSTYPNQPPPPPPKDSGTLSSNYSPYGGGGQPSAYQQWIQSRQQKIGPQVQDQVQQQLPSQIPGGAGPKPIRFQLQPKRGGGKNSSNKFNAMSNNNRSQMGGFNNSNSNNVNSKSNGYDEDFGNPNFMPLGGGNIRQGEAMSQQQSWNGYSAIDKRSALLPTPADSKQKNSNPMHTLTQQQINNAMVSELELHYTMYFTIIINQKCIFI